MHKGFAALGVAVAIAGLGAVSTASASAATTTPHATASPSFIRVSCVGPYLKWPVKIVHYGWQDQCFQFPNGGGETLWSNDYYDEVWAGGYRITVYYAGDTPHSRNPGEKVVEPGGLLQKIVELG